MTREPSNSLRMIDRRTDKLPCKLSAEDLSAKGQELGRLLEKRSEHVEYEKEVKKRLQAEGAELDALIGKTASVVRSGREELDVEVQVWANYDVGEIREIRMDTHEDIVVRAMRASERQPQLVSVAGETATTDGATADPLTVEDPAAGGEPLNNVEPAAGDGSLPDAPAKIETTKALQRELAVFGFDVPLAVVKDWTPEIFQDTVKWLDYCRNQKDYAEPVPMPPTLDGYAGSAQ